MPSLETAIQLTTSINERFSLNNLQLIQLNRSLMLSAGTTISERQNDWMICAGPIGITGGILLFTFIGYALRDKYKKGKEAAKGINVKEYDISKDSPKPGRGGKNSDIKDMPEIEVNTDNIHLN